MTICSTLSALARRSAPALVAVAVIIGALGALSVGEVQAADAPPATGAALDIAPQAAPDEGGTGVNNFKREEWFEFSIMLAPFLVLVTFILILIFKWDSHAGIGEDED